MQSSSKKSFQLIATNWETPTGQYVILIKSKYEIFAVIVFFHISIIEIIGYCALHKYIAASNCVVS